MTERELGLISQRAAADQWLRTAPVLPLRQLRERAIVSARPQKPLLYKGFCGLGGHEVSVTGLGARVVRRSRRFLRGSGSVSWRAWLG